MRTRHSGPTVWAFTALTLLSGCFGGAATEDEQGMVDAADASSDMGSGGVGGAPVGSPRNGGAAGHDAPSPDAGVDGLSPGGPAKLPVNETCTVAAQCPSGFCVDGICCDTACTGSCQSCVLTGKVGTCSAVRNAEDDSCEADSICDGSGSCRKDLGASCSTSSQCASGNCVDGVCCTTASCGTCQSCGLPGSEGWCTAVPKFSDDTDSACSGASTCDGLGACRLKNGSACSVGNECVSLSCTDGVCCNEACDGTCFSCNQTGSEGTCKPLDGVEDLSAADTCSGSDICSTPAGGSPSCKIKDGQPCTNSAECLHGSCLTIYADADGDGYGAAVSRICVATVPPGFVTRGGDCCDADPRAHGGQSAYSPAKNACGSFDWNCDGRVERSDGGVGTGCGCITLGQLGSTCIACR